MEASNHRWLIPLERSPAIRFAGRGLFQSGHRQTWKLDFWCVHLYRNRASLWLDGRPFEIRPRCAGLIPPRVTKTYHFHERSVHLCSHFHLPLSRRPAADIPVLQDLGPDFERAWNSLQEAIEQAPARPERANAILWELLWWLTDCTSARGAPGPSPVERARRTIERRLGERLNVAAIAQEAGLSHNHLTRLFRAKQRQTIVGYIRARRVARARHLLLHSTQPIKSIAVEVGIPDLHQFNKVIRRELGWSPRRIRGKQMD